MLYPPRRFIEEFAREHPWLAVMLLVFHGACWVFVIWLLVEG